MTALASYSTGLATVSAGGTTVTGSGTIWSGTNVKPGDIFQIGNFQSVISDVTDTTHLVIPPWGGGNQSGVAYTIWQVSPQRFAGAEAMATVNELVAAFRTSGFFVFVDIDETDPDPSLGDDGQYAFQPTTGKTWAKVSGVWAYLGIYKGFNFTGAYNGSTTYSVGDVMTDAGSSYVWINATPGSGHAAPNATYWQLLASIGGTGPTGATGAGYGGTSTTSLAIGTGSKVFTTQAGLAYTNGARVRASSAANPTTDWMEGVATYSGTTLTVTVDKTNGSGTHADWNFNVGGEPGTTGVASIDGATGAFTTSNGIETAAGVIRLTGARRTLPTRQVFTSGSGTYTTPANCLWIEVELVGGGAGGAGGGSGSPGAGTSGGNTTFSTMTAGGGASGSIATPGAAGTATGGDVNIPGGRGQGGGLGELGHGAQGGSSSLGGSGSGGIFGANSAGFAAAANSGSGGGGGTTNAASTNTGAGGSSGGTVQKIITSPAASYSYAVGAGGSGGAAGTSGTAGGNGAAGIIIVTEHYGS
ncbi:hypothetical protein [Bradyrhizobium sp. 25ACV]